MIIEFLGLPGSGKTTIRRELLTHFKTINAPTFLSAEEAGYLRMKSEGDRIYRSLLQILPYTTGLKLAEWASGRSLFQCQAQNSFIAEYGKSLSAFLNSATFEKMLVADKQNVIGNFLEMGVAWRMLDAPEFSDVHVFFEEGFIQKSFMFVDHAYCYAAIENSLHTYFQNIPLPDIVVHVKTEVEQSHQRMLGRQDGLTNRLKGQSEQTINHFLNQAEEHIGHVMRLLSAQNKCRVIEVQNDAPLEEVVRITRKELSNHLKID